MIKQFSAGDITIRPFNTFKNWKVQSIDSSSVDAYGYSTYYDQFCEINEGKKISSIFYPSGSPYYSASLEPINPSGKYARNIYSLTDSMFYRNKNNFTELFGVESYTTDKTTGKKEIRNINDRVVSLALNHNAFGDKVRPNSVVITDNSNPHEEYRILDDGYSNLYISGSHFSTYTILGGVKNIYPIPYWDTSSYFEYYLNLGDGITRSIDLISAKEYATIGMNVSIIGTASILFNSGSIFDNFQSENEHFGESVSSWYKYVVVGSSIDKYSLYKPAFGYAAIFKYDDETGTHRLLKKLNCPFTSSGFFNEFDQDNTFPFSAPSGLESSSYYADTFGQSVSVRDNFLAVGSSSGSICNSGSFPGYVFVYDKDKGGIDNWGIISILQGNTDNDYFGHSVSLDEDILAVGAPNVSGSGAVYIFRRKRFLSEECDNAETSSFWQPVAGSEDFCEELITESGSYSIFGERNIESSSVYKDYTWVYETVITSSISDTGDKFGWCVSLDSGSLVVGTYKSGNGYVAVFTCSYYSASAGECPTASWDEYKILRRDNTYGDLDMSMDLYSNDVTSTEIATDGFGTSVSISYPTIIVGCLRDKAFIPYSTYSGNASVLGAAYFYTHMPLCGTSSYWKTLKTFGDRQFTTNNNFGKAVSIDGNFAAVTSWADTTGTSVDYISGEYVLQNYSYASTSSEDPAGVLGRVSIYNYDDVSDTWKLSQTIKRNKEAYKPSNIYGYAVSVSSDFLTVGAPVVHFASASSAEEISDPANLVDFPANCSGSVYVYNLGNYENSPLIGNVFYKNGYFVLTTTASNYYNIFTGTGSRGFDLNYEGSHTIYEHEHLVSIRPGEFNYSTNPTSLVQISLLFDVNQDGVFDFLDVDLIMRYLQNKRFFEEFVFDDNGIVLEQDSLKDYSWWNNDILQLESGDVLLLEQDDSAYLASSSFNAFTKTAFDYIQSKLVNTGLLDIDGDGKININDGNILSLYYLQRLTPQRLDLLTNENSTRKYVKEIKEYLNTYCRSDNAKVNPYFLEYQYSSSYDPTGSYLAPFITTIGLYDGNELVAVGKLGRPVKNLIDWPLNIVVRFDT
jgi:hypothetical protein